MTPPPRVLLLTELFPPAVGGTPVLFEAIYARLPGIATTVLTDAGHDASGDGRGIQAGMTVVRRAIKTRQWGLLNAGGLRHHVRVASMVASLSAHERTIVHCARALPEGVQAWINRWRGGAPYVCWSHGEDLTTARTSRELSWLTKRVFSSAAACIVNSANTGRMLETFGISASRIHVVYPGVDVERFHEGLDGGALRSRLVREGEILCVTVGRLQRRKGHDLAIEAIARLGASSRVRYVIVGDGEERTRLEQLAAQLGVGDRVRFAGEVPVHELPLYFAAADIFLMPNRVEREDIEGFGIVFLEAAACGRPAIGGNSGGVPEAVVHGETGLLVSGTDVAELAAAIETLAGSAELRNRLGTAGRSRARRLFTWDRAAEETARVHRAVAADEWGAGPG